MSEPQSSESRSCFSENSPRPPVPGEERGCFLSSSPDPQRSSCDATGAPLGYEPEGRCDRAIVMELQQHHQQRVDSAMSPLNCLQWPKSLRTLLGDPKGVELFEHFLHQEGNIYALYFWFACEGLKEERDPNRLLSIIKVLFRRFFQRPQLALPDNVRKEMTRRFREGSADKRMFDMAQLEVERIMEEGPYPNFLRSDVYLQYVQYCQLSAGLQQQQQIKASEDQHLEQLEHLESKERMSSPDEPSLPQASLLPTLHEDNELTIQQQRQQHRQEKQHHHTDHHHQYPHLSNTHQHSSTSTSTTTEGSASPHSVTTTRSSAATMTDRDHNKGEMRLTKDMLMATQQLRALEVRPKPEAYAGLYLQPGASPYHASVPAKPRVQYSSYNPVSRQDSELQSLSSDARTESDNLSLTDASLSDSASMSARRNCRKQYIRQHQQIKKSAMMNRDGHEGIIPRTQRLSREQTQPLKPESFARQLIEKLERVKRDRENEEKLERKLREVDMPTGHGDSLCESSSMQCPTIAAHHQSAPRTLTDTLREKLQLDDDNVQDILDQHVSRVWSDLTPSRSPKLASPRPRSPSKLLQQPISHQQQQQQHPQLIHGYTSQQQPQLQQGAVARQQALLCRATSGSSTCSSQQRKEKADVFSTFSGDSGNVHDFPEAASLSSLGSHLPKSKSVPSDYADSLHKQDLYLQGQDQRYRRLDATRSSATKKSMTELTDSGVSVVSDVPPRLRDWLRSSESDTSGLGCGGKPDMGASGVSAKPKSKKLGGSLPQQPFVGDPGMPLLPQPHTATQLDEARRRLELQEKQLRQTRGNSGNSTKSEHDLVAPASCNQSTQSTLRRAGRQEPTREFTTVVFSFCDEKVPYRTKIQGYNVTLKQFKEVLPKKGSYRYFFKTECEDLEMAVIQEEITDDGEILPLWEGKIMAQVKALE